MRRVRQLGVEQCLVVWVCVPQVVTLCLVVVPSPRIRCSGTAMFATIRRFWHLQLLLPLCLAIGRRRYVHPRGRVSRLDRRTIYKLSYVDEALTLRYVAQNTSIPVPEVYDFWEVEHGNTVILMEYIDGVQLDSVWYTLRAEQKDDILSQLKGFIEQLRSLPFPPGSPIASASGGECLDMRVSSFSFGTFATEKDFNDKLIARLTGLQTAEKLRNLRTLLRDDHAILFSHGDLVPRNILVRDGRIVALVDWEQAGWRPEYWEWLKALYAPGASMESEWPEVISKVLTPYEAELQVDLELRDIEGFPI
jgi:tRNA A-37 threonylcarbamoyl transferase component Bud32